MTETPKRPLEGWRIGFAGLGLMGRPMALHLYDAGGSLVLWNRTASVAERLARPHMAVCATPGGLAAQSDIVVLMLADTDAVEQVLFAPDGLADGLQRGSLVIDMGTTAVMPTREFAARLGERGIEFVDAPVSGGEIGAIASSYRRVLPPRPAGTLAILEARPLDIVMLTHRGLEGFAEIRDIWSGGLVGSSVQIRFWRIPHAEVPRDAEDRRVLLFSIWASIDRWVTAEEDHLG